MILAIDQGTTGTTALAVDPNGSVQAKAYREFQQYYPRAGWVEHDANAIWQTVIETASEVLQDCPAPEAIGITNQRETIVVWDRQTGLPAAPAIVWQDRRTAEMCKTMKAEGMEARIRAKTGLVLDPYFSGTKLKWLLSENSDVQALARAGRLAAGTVDSWLLWNLTHGRVHATEPTNASRTLLFNLRRQGWDEELLEQFGIPISILAEIRPSAGEFGVTGEGPWGAGVPITGIAGDQQAALFGQGCLESGTVKNTYGTGCFLLCHQGSDANVPKSPVLCTSAISPGGEPAFALEGSVFIAGAAVQWLRDELGLIDCSEESEVLARRVPDSDGVIVVPAFTGLGAPHWNAEARGAVRGLSRGSNAAHIARATLEGIAFQVADLVAIPELGGCLNELRVDGGACRNDLLMQIQSDLLGIPVNRPANIETTATGAAYLAGMGAGFWSSTEDVQRLRKTDRIFEPSLSEDERQTRLSAWHDALNRIL